MTARPALDAWLSEVDDVLERAMPADQCDPDDINEWANWPAGFFAAPPTPLGVEHDTATTLRRVVAVALKPIKTATTWWGWDRL
jgi:hypothetical protein